MSWLSIAALAAGSYLTKAVGPLLLRGRGENLETPRATLLLAAALLAALVAVQTFGDGRSLTLDARAAGMGAAVAAVWLRVPFVIVVVLAAATTAAVRAFS